MGTANVRRNDLQWIANANLKRLLLTIGLVAWLSPSARAEIFPVRATFNYSSTSQIMPALAIETTDGKRYEFTLSPVPWPNPEYFDLVLRSAGTGTNPRNLLEPKLKNWHGYQSFMLAAWDYDEQPEKSTYGATRNFILSKERFALTVSVTKATTTRIPNVSKGRSYLFEELTLEVHASNLN